MLQTTTIVVAIAFAATGCGAANGGSDPESAATSSPTPTAPEGANVEQWASLVATHERGWRDQAETVEDDCLDPATVVACAVGYQTLSFMAQTIEVDLEGATDPDAVQYLGEPPAEIAGLVAGLVEAAGTVEPAVTEWQDLGCEDPLSLECGVSESQAMNIAVADVTEAFDAWAPYL